MLLNDYLHHGFAIVPDVLSSADMERVIGPIEAARRTASATHAVANRTGVYAIRNLTEAVPEVCELLKHSGMVTVVTAVLGTGAFMTRATLFDKTPGANWGVFWHRDLSIAVKARHAVPGFSGWTRKAGVTSVQPGPDVMRQILAVRLHLDDCTAANGALRVLPGTHHDVSRSAPASDSSDQLNHEVVCEVPAGGALLMNPLLLHASSPMTGGGPRRVIHFEFAGFDLPSPLEWQFRLPCS